MDLNLYAVQENGNISRIQKKNISVNMTQKALAKGNASSDSLRCDDNQIL